MKHPSLALLILLGLCAIAQGQSLARVSHATNEASTQEALAARALSSLKRLDDDVIVYRSLGEFEESGKLARVSLETFHRDLHEATAEVEAVLPLLTDRHLKTAIRNTLASYRDGAFWWRQVYQPRVVHVSSLTSSERDCTPGDAFLLANIPYTVAIHWRQANKYLQRSTRQAFQLVAIH